MQDISIIPSRSTQVYPLLTHIPEPQHQVVLAAFQDAITTGAPDPHEIVRTALLALRGQLQGPWKPGRDALRSAIITLMAHPSESLQIAQTLLEGQKGGE